MGKKQRAVAFFTDSTSSMPADLVEQYDIGVIPMHIIWGHEDMLDGVEITTEQFYNRLPRDPIHPKTSQPNAKQFAEAIQKAAKAGAKEAVIIAISTKLSKAYDSAAQAQKMVDIPVHLLDSKSAGMATGWQLVAAARTRDAGGDIEAILAAAEKARQHMSLHLTVDTLEYLHKGGRIGGAAKLVGTALQLKPRLYVNHQTGIIEPGEKTRTRKKAIDSVYEAFFDTMDTTKPMHIAVHHAVAEEDAGMLAARIRDEYNPQELLVVDLPPVIGVHVGPGALGIAGYYED
ncbi:MAG: DegV family protein [Anaerolineae bacterium]|nr:DegV family protein [Anaerolineae bacterium]